MADLTNSRSMSPQGVQEYNNRLRTRRSRLASMLTQPNSSVDSGTLDDISSWASKAFAPAGRVISRTARDPLGAVMEGLRPPTWEGIKKSGRLAMELLPGAGMVDSGKLGGQSYESFKKGDYTNAALQQLLGAAMLATEIPMLKGAKPTIRSVANQLTDSPYYSRLADSLNDPKMQNKMTGGQLRAHFKNHPEGVGRVELEHTGVDKFFEQPKVTRDEVVEQYNANRLELKDTDYRADGKLPKNVEEELRGRADEMARVDAARSEIDAADIDSRADVYYRNMIDEFEPMHHDLVLPGYSTDYTERAIRSPGVKFADIHDPFPEDTIMHQRFVRREVDGMSSTHIEEGQSDIHQAGRKVRKDEIKRIAADRNVQAPGKNQKPSAEYKAIMNEVPENFGYSNKLETLDNLTEGNPKYKLERIKNDTGDDVTRLTQFDSDGKISDIHEANRANEGILTNWISEAGGGIPDAPYKNTNDWTLINFKRALKEAVDNGDEMVSWTAGVDQVNRFPGVTEKQRLGLTKYYDEQKTGVVSKYVKKKGGSVQKRGMPITKSMTKDEIQKIESMILPTDTLGHDIALNDFGLPEGSYEVIKSGNGFMLKILDSSAKKTTQVWGVKITPKMAKSVAKGVALSGAGVAATSLMRNDEDIY
jgi:hypothetical protein